jgi:hypothetical protein
VFRRNLRLLIVITLCLVLTSCVTLPDASKYRFRPPMLWDGRESESAVDLSDTRIFLGIGGQGYVENLPAPIGTDPGCSILDRMRFTGPIHWESSGPPHIVLSEGNSEWVLTSKASFGAPDWNYVVLDFCPELRKPNQSRVWFMIVPPPWPTPGEAR